MAIEASLQEFTQKKEKENQTPGIVLIPLSLKHGRIQIK